MSSAGVVWLLLVVLCVAFWTGVALLVASFV
jgi:hypothetical protein